MMQINANERNQKIKLYKPVAVEDGQGGRKTEYALIGTRWAQVSLPTYKELQAQGAPMSKETITVKIQPQLPALRRGWRIEWRGETYTVQSTDNLYRERTLFAAQLLNPGE